MSEISPIPTIAVTIGRETHLYYAFVTTAPARLDGPRTMTLYVGTFAEVSGWAASQLPCDAARANTPTRVVLVEASERRWHRTSYRSEGHVFAEADSILCLNTLQHWLWQRLYAPIVSDVGGHQTAAHLESEDVTPRMPTLGVHMEITMTTIEIKIHRPDHQPTPGKLAEAKLHFTGGELDGLKLVGFAVWEARNGGKRYVSLPARQFAVDGARCSFILLRWIADPKAQDRLRNLVLEAYAGSEKTKTAAAL